MEYVCKSKEERMKKAVILGLIALNISVFAAIKQEVPEDIEKAIIRESQSFEGSDRISFRRWQTESYLKMEKMGAESGIPAVEFDRIKQRLRQMYGSNFVKQYQVLPSEIANYNELVERVKVETLKSAVVTEEKNNAAKEQMAKEIASSKVPAEVVEIFKESAAKLYPDNYVGQKAYINAAMEDYFKIIDFVKKNKKVLN